MRRRMRVVRKRLAEAHPDAAARVCPHLWESARPLMVGGYRPQSSELDPGPVLAVLINAGWTASLPRAADRDSPLTYHAIDGAFTRDAFGIPAPPATAKRMAPDLIIVPLLAFDRRGRRLGQGAGCYDRTIAALRAAGTVRVIGLAYAGQEVDCIPAERHDQRLDGILTDKEFIEVIDPPS